MKDLLKTLEKHKKITLTSIVDGAEGWTLARLAEEQAKAGTFLYIARDDMRMHSIAQELRYFAPNTQVITLPAWDCLPYDRVSPHASIVSERITSLCQLLDSKTSSKKSRIVLTTINSLLQRVPPRSALEKAQLQIKTGQTIDRTVLVSFLIDNGYVRTDTANEPGEFALRGSIIDLVTSHMEEGFRLDFFGNNLETIRTYDPLTQVSGGQTTELSITPANEVILNQETIQHFRQRYRELFPTIPGKDPLYEAVSEGRKYAGLEHWLPLFYSKLETVFDYVGECIVCYDHLSLEARAERLTLIQDYYETRKAQIRGHDVNYYPVPSSLMYLGEKECDDHSLLTVQFNAFALPDSETVIDLKLAPAVNIASEAARREKTVFDTLKDVAQETRQWNNKGTQKQLKCLIACSSEGSLNRLQNMLREHDMHAMRLEGWHDLAKVSGKTVGLSILDMERGFVSDQFMLFSEQDVLGERLSRVQKNRKRKVENFLSEAASLIAGELVVHREHGIGRFEGLETLTVSGAAHDCLRLVYEGGDKLFVPVENIEVITRYGMEDGVSLDRLGSQGWQSRKAKLKKRIKLAAEELLRVAAERSVRIGPVLAPSKTLYDTFCARFNYVETDDQLASIAEVEQDLASGKPMDRLICGDVGFGKTEVALRAAFMAVCAEPDPTNPTAPRPQVAVIVPTTLLCRQHYKTFTERFKGLPVRIKQLSRLVTSKEATDIRNQLASGDIDIVVGTHALLAKNVTFKNLSLVIIDEEQHFGVVQKERLKQYRANIHVLTLSATPIPRTLQMSLTGIKELSIIATPPIDRLAVRTFVMPYDPVIVREAILREHYRGGRIFYVCPRISDLEEVSKQLSELVPEVKHVVAHGQMAPQTLDQIVGDFYDGTFDVLVSTSIVESGLDVPSANTLLIHRADMFGLAQLYQLRGRVGRGKIRAYAYFTVPPRKTPTRMAQKRLEVMQTLDGLGAGFSLASHDMDIRGFGNLVGDEQSGHIKEVGIELYQEMLQEAVLAIRTKSTEEETDLLEEWSPQINVGLSVLIPESYVPDLSLRMGLYRRIVELTTETELEAFAAEMIDRFGPLPDEANHLLAIVRIKQRCKQLAIDKIDAGPKGTVIGFRHHQNLSPEALLWYITMHPNTAKVRPDQKLLVMQSWENARERLTGIYRLLGDLMDVAKMPVTQAMKESNRA